MSRIIGVLVHRVRARQRAGRGETQVVGFDSGDGAHVGSFASMVLDALCFVPIMHFFRKITNLFQKFSFIYLETLYYSVKCVCNERRHTHNEVREKRSNRWQAI